MNMTDFMQMSLEDQAQFFSKLDKLFWSMENDANFLDNWCGNGCEHGFKPACDCPNDGCEDADMHRLWKELME